jgi:hypothetical protein
MLGGRDADDDAPTLDQKVSLGDRLKNAILKPVDPNAASTGPAPDTPESVEELEAAVKSLRRQGAADRAAGCTVGRRHRARSSSCPDISNTLRRC